MKIFDICVKGLRQEYPVVIGDSRQEYTILVNKYRKEYDLYVDGLPNNFELMIHHKIPLISNSLQPSLYAYADGMRILNKLILDAGDTIVNKAIKIDVLNNFMLSHSMFLDGKLELSLIENNMAMTSVLNMKDAKKASLRENTLAVTVSVNPKQTKTVELKENHLKLHSDMFLSGKTEFKPERNTLVLTSSLDILSTKLRKLSDIDTVTLAEIDGQMLEDLDYIIE